VSRSRWRHSLPGNGNQPRGVSLNIVLQWLQVYRAFPHERLRIFSSPSQETLNEQLVRENQGLASTSVPATQFLQARGITPRGAVREACAGGSQAHERTISIPAETGGTSDESGMSELYKRREAFERGAGGDHDLPYRFTLPTSTPQALAWIKLLARGELQDFQLEVGAIGSSNRGTGARLDPPCLLVSKMASTWHAAPSPLRD
jgi:hypothetical protein